MNDFLVYFGEGADAAALAAMLRDRPAVAGHAAEAFEFPWGAVAVQPPAARGYAPLHDESANVLAFAVGRPRFVGVEHERAGGHGFNRLFRDKLRAAGPQAASDALTGMFAAVVCGRDGVRVLTDPMGFMPVYAGRDAGGRVVAVGTHPDSVAALAGRSTDFDLVSLGDLLVSQYVTFPYTTRRGVTQLEPGALTEFAASGGAGGAVSDVRTTVLWQPREPDPAARPTVAELEEELAAALRFAAEDITRGVSGVALTLSGGLDSRLVLASILREKVAAAITYATRPNHEVEVARRVAAAAGVRHHIAWRGEEFYAELMPRAVALLGTELRGECHGFCIVDNGLDRAYDLIVGGFLSDTLFKGHYLPEAVRERLRRRAMPLYDRARRTAADAARALGVLPPPNVKPTFWDLTRRMGERLVPDVREALRERHRVRLEQVRRVRPESAEEWVRFWPASRADGAYGPQANTRLFTVDELFMHRRLVEVAARIPMEEKLGGRLSKRVFPRFYGALGEIENANTGLPAAAATLTAASRPRNGHGTNGYVNGNGNGRANGHGNDHANGHGGAVNGMGSQFPWNDVQHSWVDYELLQKHSPTWASYRAALKDSPALDVLDHVLAGGIRGFVAAYRDEAGFLFNRAAVQLAYAIDRAVRREVPQTV